MGARPFDDSSKTTPDNVTFKKILRSGNLGAAGAGATGADGAVDEPPIVGPPAAPQPTNVSTNPERAILVPRLVMEMSSCITLVPVLALTAASS
jgi:hypothetical protein